MNWSNSGKYAAMDTRESVRFAVFGDITDESV